MFMLGVGVRGESGGCGCQGDHLGSPNCEIIS